MLKRTVHCSRADVTSRVLRRTVSALLAPFALLPVMASAATPVSYVPLAQPLPVPCAAGACGAAIPGWAPNGGATLSTPTPTSMTVNQSAQNVLLNWASFNIGKGYSVNFSQPNSSAVALNQIWQQDPTQIWGSLTANGTVYLLNQNGFLFGQGSTVNVGSLVASSLALNPLAGPNAFGLAGLSSQGLPAFSYYTQTNPDGTVTNLPSGNITIQSGASITSNGGQILVFAPNISNAGTIASPDGQTMLAAGQRAFLLASTDPTLRGLLIAVGDGGTLTNAGSADDLGGIGNISAARGNVTLAGLAVNQNGRVSATTTVRTNGSIRLQAGDTPNPQLPGGVLEVDREGAVTLGANSVTEVTLEGSSSDKTVDVNAQPKSRIDIAGRSIDLLQNARISATSGNVSLTATQDPQGLLPSAVPDAGHIYMADGVVIDVSGAVVQESVSDNSLQVQLRGSEFANSPQQRNGALRGLTVWVDQRLHGTNPDGSTWIGTPIADLTGDAATVQRDVYQRNLAGGAVSMTASGAVIESATASIDIAGGAIDWQAGYVKTSTLLGANGVAYDIGVAQQSRSYVGTLDSISASDPHWGTTVTAASFGRNPNGIWTPGYVEGKDAGTVAIIAPHVILDGAVNGSVQVGPLQLNAPTAIPNGLLYRWADQVPLGGQLILGNSGAVGDRSQSAYLGDVVFGGGAVLASLKTDAGAVFNPLTDQLPLDFTSRINPALLGSGGVSRLAVYSTGVIDVPAGITLAPGIGGSVTLAAGRIDFAGVIEAPGGSVALIATPTSYDGAAGIHAEAGAKIDVSGVWVNDSNAVITDQIAPLLINGGSVTLNAQVGSLDLPAGMVIAADGGAQRTAAGSLVAGNGGAIQITDTGPAVYGASVEAYSLSKGGSLALSLPSVCIGASLCADPAATQLLPTLFTDRGFSSIAVTANAGSLTVEAGTDLSLQQTNWRLLPGAATADSASSLRPLVQTTTLPDGRRGPVNLRLASFALNGGVAGYGDLVIEAGSTIKADPLATITVQSDSRIFDNGTLIAPGGTVSLDLAGKLASQSYQADQGIWIGPNATIDVSGTFVPTPNAAGLDLGTVLPGGTVNVLAETGSLFVMPGAVLRADGSNGSIDVRLSPTDLAYAHIDAASAGGTINLEGAEALQVAGTLSGHAGAGASITGASAAGGTLNLILNGDLVKSGGRTSGSYPSTPRVLTITTTDETQMVAQGDALPIALNGVGTIAENTIQAGGFDQIGLAAATLLESSGGAPFAVAPGTVAFESGVNLHPALSLTIDASQLSGLGAGKVTLGAPYVTLGSFDLEAQYSNPNPQAAAAALDVEAGSVLSLVGSLDLNGFAAARLASGGDLRLVGLQSGGATQWTGKLVSAAPLTLAAQQIYPVTLTQYEISVLPNGGTLSIEPVAGSAAPLYSAAGQLTLTADEINDAGTLRAPFGTITFNAPTVNLLSGSETSVSGNGLTVPFGQTQGGLSWVYPIIPSLLQVYGTQVGAVAPPSKTIAINAAHVNLQTGATLDVSGGGDLLASEFTAGLTGTRDVLSNVVSPGLYAVIPGPQALAAPIDPLISQGFTPTIGSSVYLAGGNGLPAGVYTLLPARYALLPGAYLVQSVAGYTDISPAAAQTQLNGGVVMAGYRTWEASGLGGTRYSGFLVTPGSYALTLASYTTTSANAFFANQAAVKGAAVPQLPIDAGSVAITATAAALLNGRIDGTHIATGSRGSKLDFSSTDIYVGDSANAPTGFVVLDSTQLNAIGADSILLGATRTESVNGAVVNLSADQVILGAGSHLTGNEILLAAESGITVEAGASVASSAKGTSVFQPLVVSAGSSFMGVSNGSQAYSYAAGAYAGDITIAPGAVVSGVGTVAMLSGGNFDFAGSLAATGAQVVLGSKTIALGNAPANFAGLSLTPSLLSGLNAGNLELLSATKIQIFGSTALSLSTLELLAPGMQAATADAALTVTAKSVSFGSSSQTGSVPAQTSGTGTVTVNADTVTLTGGNFVFDGMGSTTLNATHAIVANGSGIVAASGDLRLLTPEIVASRPVDTRLVASGVLSATGVGAARDPAITAAPGAAISLEGASVTLATQVRSASGTINITADAGTVTLGAGALVDVAGFSETFAGKTVSASGGSVTLKAVGGDVLGESGATVDVSAGTGQAAGGRLTVSAPTGQVTLAGNFKGQSAQAVGAALAVDATSVDFNSIVALNNQDGFTGDLALRQRGSGDFVLASDATLKATTVTLEADQGAVDIAGTIDARSATGGSVSLAASGDVHVEGSILANATGYTTRGGQVELDTLNGGLYLAPTSTISVGGKGGTATGTVWLRLPAAAAHSVLIAGTPQLQLRGVINGASRTVVEGYHTYDTRGPVFTAFANGGVIDSIVETADPNNKIWADAAAFGADAALIAQALGKGADATFSVLPGIEITSTGDLTLSTAWDLSAQNVGPTGLSWHFGPNGNVPGVLTLRAAGSLNLQASLSDGFAGITSYTLSAGFGPSWSYRLIGGADLGASAPLAVQSTDALLRAGLNGDVFIAPGIPLDSNNPLCSPVCGPTVVRTGSGFVAIAAGRDVVLGNQASVVYTAGRADPRGLTVADIESNFGGLAYPTDGGNLSVSAGRDVVGALSDQLFTDWLWRAGTNVTSSAGYNPSAWSVNFGLFEQGFGALGGGDLQITAGRNLLDVGANVPTIGMPVGDGTQAGTEIVQLGSGLLTVRAGRDLAGGSYLAMGLGGEISAGSSLTNGSPLTVSLQGSPLLVGSHAPVLALGSGTLEVTAQQNLEIDTVVNPTLLPRSSLQSPDPGQEYYSTYGQTGTVRLLSAGGDLTLDNATQPGEPLAFGSINLPIGATSTLSTNWGPALRAYPPNLDATAMTGSVTVQGSMGLLPSSRGTLNLLAGQNVNIATTSGTNTINIIQSDMSSALLGTPDAPASSIFYLQIFDTANAFLPLEHAPTPTHIDAQGIADPVPNLVVALNGDIVMQRGDTGSHASIQSAKSIDVIAGHDIVDLGLAAQNLEPGSVDLVQAGHDISYELNRSLQSGLLNSNERTIDVAGPGALLVVAGHNVDLGTSRGITTSGALSNAALPAQGANLSVLAGVGAQMQAPAFFNTYVTNTNFDATALETYVQTTLGLPTKPDMATALADYLALSDSQQYGLAATAPGTAYAAWLIGYVTKVTGIAPADKAAALTAYATLSPAEQFGLVEQIFVSELRAGGRIAAAAGKTHNDYARAFSALTSLFPGSDTRQGTATSTYAGDLLLYFSRVYTLQGGDINLYAPGGQINVGLAAAPSSFGVLKDPSQLGIVAESVGSVTLVANTDIQVNQSRIFAANGGNILVWSTTADIDAGRGAKTAISAPPPVITVNANGQVTQTFPAALTGSGIQALATTPDVTPGDVDLFAPKGVVNANDAGIVAGNITIGATAVLGAGNISFSGTSVGVPVAVTGLGAGMMGAASTGAAASSEANSSADSGDRAQKARATDLPVGMLDVAVVSLGEDDCKQDDADCLRRQKH